MAKLKWYPYVIKFRLYNGSGSYQRIVMFKDVKLNYTDPQVEKVIDYFLSNPEDPMCQEKLKKTDLDIQVTALDVYYKMFNDDTIAEMKTGVAEAMADAKKQKS